MTRWALDLSLNVGHRISDPMRILFHVLLPCHIFLRLRAKPHSRGPLSRVNLGQVVSKRGSNLWHSNAIKAWPAWAAAAKTKQKTGRTWQRAANGKCSHCTR